MLPSELWPFLLLFLHIPLPTDSSKEKCQVTRPLQDSCSCQRGTQGLHISCSGLNSTQGFTSLKPTLTKDVIKIVIVDSFLQCLDMGDFANLSQLSELQVIRSGITQAFCSNESGGGKVRHKKGAVMMGQLHRLDLSHNLLREVGTSLSLMHSLKQLDLSHNRLIQVSKSVFPALTNLQSLDLSSNKLSSDLSHEAIQGLTKRMQFLDLSDNSFACSPALSWIYPWSTTLSDEVQKQLSKVQCDVENSPTGQHSPLLTVMKYYSTQVNPYCPPTCSCHFYHFVDTPETKEDTITHRNNLAKYTVMVNCSGRNLTRFPSLPPQTIVLDMSHNQLSQDSYTELDLVQQNYKDLSGLNLSYNRLTSIDSKLLKLRLHRSFKADHNHLTDIPYDFSLTLQKYDKNQITLGHNPWHCTCNSEITDHSLQEKIHDIDSVVCSKGSIPESITGTQLRSVDSAVLCPRSQRAEEKEMLLRAVCGCLASLIIVVLAKLLYDYWQYRNKGKLPRIVYMMP